MPPMPLMPPRIFAPAGSSFNTKDSELLTIGAGAGGNVPIDRVGSGLARDNRVARRIHQNAVEARGGSETRSHIGGAPDEGGVDDLAVRVQLGDEALKRSLHGGLQSAGRNGKIRRVGIAENIHGAAGIDGDGPRDAEVAAGEAWWNRASARWGSIWQRRDRPLKSFPESRRHRGCPRHRSEPHRPCCLGKFARVPVFAAACASSETARKRRAHFIGNPEEDIEGADSRQCLNASVSICHRRQFRRALVPNDTNSSPSGVNTAKTHVVNDLRPIDCYTRMSQSQNEPISEGFYPEEAIAHLAALVESSDRCHH